MRGPIGGRGKQPGWGMKGWIGGSILLLVGLAGAVAMVWAVRATKEGKPA